MDVGLVVHQLLGVEISDLNQRPFRNVAEITADSADLYDTAGPVPLVVGDIDSVPDSDPGNDVQTIDQWVFQPGVDGLNDAGVDSELERVRAETEWMQAAETADLPLSIFRLSGIYGPGRNALRSASEGRSRRLIKKGQVFNRIHVRDIAKATELAMAKSVAGIFNVTDDEPAPPQDVVTFAHHLLGSEPPPELDFETAELSPMARSFYGDNKRVSNARSKAEFGMDYDWPNYRAALKRMLDENDW